MAEFQEVVKNFKRMCDSYEACEECPMSTTGTARSTAYCRYCVFEQFEESERIIMQWSAEHPIVTNGMKFREIFGINLDSIEVICRDGEGKVSHHQDVSAWLSKEYKEG